MTEQENARNGNELEDLLRGLTTIQLRYVSVRPFVRFDSQAAKEIGISPGTVSRWENKDDVDEAVRLMAMDGVVVASEMFRRHLPKAADEIVTQLEHRRVDVRHRAAKEILDRGGLVPRRQIEHSGDMNIVLTWGDAGEPDDNTA